MSVIGENRRGVRQGGCTGKESVGNKQEEIKLMHRYYFDRCSKTKDSARGLLRCSNSTRYTDGCRQACIGFTLDVLWSVLIDLSGNTKENLNIAILTIRR